MPADLDELFARADALDEELPTREELIAELREALDELERRWPCGEPSDTMERISYHLLHTTIVSNRGALEAPEGVCYVDRKPALVAIRGGRDAR